MLIFDDIGGTIKKIAKILFFVCLGLGIIVMIIGIVKFFSGVDEYTTFSEGLSCTLEDALTYKNLYADCYFGKQMIKSGFITLVGSVCFLPFYGLGELIEVSWSIKSELSKANEKITNKQNS